VRRIAPAPPRFCLPAILFYAVCAVGNLFIVRLPMATAVVTDASGRNWLTADILRSCVLVSLFVMVALRFIGMAASANTAGHGIAYLRL
jgi:hypothetical protein